MDIVDIQQLIYSEKDQNQKEMTFQPRLQPLDESKPLSQNEKTELEEAWYSFHKKANHKEFSDFYDKREFRRKYRKGVAKDEELFLMLISDRDFLFPVYSERFEDDRFSPLADKYPDDPGLLPLSEVVRAYDIYIEHGTPKDKLDYVLDHPFIPYPKHKEAYRTLQSNLKELKNAKALREKQMKELNPEFASFSCMIPKEQPEESDLNEQELVLCEIFQKYVLACVAYAYEARLDQSKMKEAPWRCAIHTVYRYLENRQEAFHGEKAIVFFHLFSKYTQKLLLGSLRQYNFGRLKERVSKGETPATAQRRTSGKIQCNIQLFDLLAEVWNMSEEQMQDLKYIFYVYSRYDKYWHYEVSRPRKGFVSFDGKEDYKDGVDHFGNLLRYNINYCIPVSAKWLLPIMVPRWREDPLETLSTFLLSETCLEIPVQDRIATRIKAYQKTEDWKKLLGQHRTEKNFANLPKMCYHSAMDKQMTMSAFSDELASVRTHKKEFLAQIERIVPWGEWISLIRPHYYKGERGNKPYDLERMLRIYLIQNLYDLSDMATVAEVIDSRAFSEFCGVDSSNQVPDGDTLGRFRNLLIRNGLQEKLFAQVVCLLTERGLILKKGTIVDSTIISAPSSTKNKGNTAQITARILLA